MRLDAHSYIKSKRIWFIKAPLGKAKGYKNSWLHVNS